MKRKPNRREPAPPGQELEVRRTLRLQTTELLKGQRTALQVIDSVRRADEMVDGLIAQSLERDPPRPPLACQEGCDWCCHKRVGTAAAEVLRIADFMRTTFTPEQLQATRQRVEELQERRHQLREDRWLAVRQPCSLLVDHRCSVYEVRPLTCRGYNSSDARKCEQSVQQREPVDVPVHQVVQRLAVFALDGLRAGQAECGLQADLLELNAALRICLDQPDAGHRWLAAEDVFATARMPS